MEKKLFIGIDFSKSKFDVTILEKVDQASFAQETFANDEEGYKALLKWVVKQSVIKRPDWLFCGEQTGLYSRGLPAFLSKKGLSFWLENPLQIKKCSGIKRGGNDRIDSHMIAKYSIRYMDKYVCWKPAGKEIEALQLLHSYRERLVRMKVSLSNAATEIRLAISRGTTSRFVFEDSTCEIRRIEKKIASIETQMIQTIMQSGMKENYELASSIKGIGPVTTIALLIHTDNFTSFENVRQLSTYCGCAPFPHSSGTVDKGNHISRLANKELKVLLTSCARSAVIHDKTLSAYYVRKTAEGKKDRVVINNVRNKLLHRIFAVVKSKIPYRQDYLNPLEKPAGNGSPAQIPDEKTLSVVPAVDGKAQGEVIQTGSSCIPVAPNRRKPLKSILHPVRRMETVSTGSLICPASQSGPVVACRYLCGGTGAGSLSGKAAAGRMKDG